MKQTLNASISNIKIKKVFSDSLEEIDDAVAIEAPLEIRLRNESDLLGKSISVTMRTPGNDELLALGFLFTEGILSDYESVLAADITEENVIEVVVKDGTPIQLDKTDRNFYTTSSCGVCGKSSIDAIKVKSSFSIKETTSVVDRKTLFDLQQKIIAEQSAFTKTGGIHASALFDLSGNLIAIREDVGRHNAMDKLIGECWQKGLAPLNNYVLMLSGRASFELIQKATMAGIPIICSVGAPSSLAIELAQENNHTLVGFLKTDRFNIYCGHHRIG